MFDDRLKNLRIARGLSQAQVAEDLGIPQKTYCNYERNQREPNSTTLIKLGVYFGVTLDYLLDHHCDIEKSPPPVEDEQGALIETIRKLDDKSLKILEEFIDYLVWKEEQG